LTTAFDRRIWCGLEFAIRILGGGGDFFKLRNLCEMVFVPWRWAVFTTFPLVLVSFSCFFGGGMLCNDNDSSFLDVFFINDLWMF
jgi:hypothetical protein